MNTKQRHTAKRIFVRLRDEHGFAGGYTVVKVYVRLARKRSREVFVPLAHPPGHAQVDFGECVGVIGGVEMKRHFYYFDLPHSDACFVKAYAAETTEAFLDGHVWAFAFFDGVPLFILYANTKVASSVAAATVSDDDEIVFPIRWRCLMQLRLSGYPPGRHYALMGYKVGTLACRTNQTATPAKPVESSLRFRPLSDPVGSDSTCVIHLAIRT